MTEVDAVVIGAGPAGEVAAGRLAEGGLDVVLVERELVGGECSYYACMPSKALRPGDLVDEVRRIPGVHLADPPIKPAEVLARRDEVIHDRDDCFIGTHRTSQSDLYVAGSRRHDSLG